MEKINAAQSSRVQQHESSESEQEGLESGNSMMPPPFQLFADDANDPPDPNASDGASGDAGAGMAEEVSGETTSEGLNMNSGSNSAGTMNGGRQLVVQRFIEEEEPNALRAVIGRIVKAAHGEQETLAQRDGETVTTETTDAELESFVNGLSDDAITAAFQQSITQENGEQEEREEHPLDNNRGTANVGHMQWDHEGYEAGQENSWHPHSRTHPHLAPLPTPEDSNTLREEFNQHREIELQTLLGVQVSVQLVLAAQHLAEQNSRPQIAESIRRILFTATQYAIVNTLNVEQSERYEPYCLRGNRWPVDREGEQVDNQTFCNTWVYDIIRAQGVVEAALTGGSADDISAFLHQPGTANFWQLLDSPTAAQSMANAGRIVIISAAGTRHAGHISLVMPENSERGTTAHRTEDSDEEHPEGGLRVDSPLESNGGGGHSWIDTPEGRRPSGNFRYENRRDLDEEHPSTHSDEGGGDRGIEWWDDQDHTNGGFYMYIGPLNNDEALGSADTMGTAT